MRNRKGGYILVMVVLVLTLMGILIPAFTRLIQKDSKDAKGITKKTIAFQLAEAGQDRGSWKLRESDAVWTAAAAGTTIAGYNNDTTYTDVSGGEYKILISAGPGPGEVTVISKGKASNNVDVRAIQGVYSKGTVAGALSVVAGLNWKPNLTVEWGPVVAYSSITAEPADKYPRKYSAGAIENYDEDPNAPNGAMPSGDWVNYDYASYYALGNPPTINLAQYKAIAALNCFPILKKGSGSGSVTPEQRTGGGCDSGVYLSTKNPNLSIDKSPGNYSFTCSTCVLYVEGGLDFPNNSWLDVKAVVTLGNMDFNAKSTTYVATIPDDAQDEYQYSPDGTDHWSDMGWTNGGTYSIANCGMHGFLYVGGSLNNAGGNSIIVGAIYIVGSITANTSTVYYDSAVGNNILYQTATISRSSWNEIRTSW